MADNRTVNKKEMKSGKKRSNAIFRLFTYIKNFYYLFIPAIILVLLVAVLSVAPVGIIDQLTKLLDSGTAEQVEESEEESLNNMLGDIGSDINVRNIINNFVDVSKDFDYFVALIVIGIIVGVLKFISFYLATFFIDYMGRKMIFHIKRDLFDTIVYLPMKYFEKGRLGKVLSIINNDVVIVQDFAGQVMMTFIKELFSIIFIVAYMLFINPSLTITLIIIGPLAVIVMNVIGKIIKKIERRIREKFSDITNIIVEVLNNILVVKSFAMEKEEKKNFIKESKRYLSYEKKFISIRALNTPFLEFIGFLAVLGVLGVGGYQILRGDLVIGDLVTFASALALISAPINNVSKGFIYIEQATASVERIFNLMDEEKEDIYEYDKPDMPTIKGNVKLDNISFSYEEQTQENTASFNIDGDKLKELSGDDKIYDKETGLLKPIKNPIENKDKREFVLKNINIEVEKKKTVAVVGLSGSGKSTLVKLIPRLIRPQYGKVYIDDNDVWQYNLHSLRKQIAIVTQDILLFHGSIADNIRYGKIDATDDEIINASKIANAYDFILKLPEKFDTQIGEKGVRLSGGQKQRIALARALVREPKILILDEATSSLDTESERAIQEAFQRINHQQTIIVIAHRLSTVINSDNIYVMDKGEIKESGTHNELIKKIGLYKRLYDLQFKAPDEELN